MNTNFGRLFLIILLVPALSFGQAKLPKLVSDGMVLQRDINVKIRGWASAGEKISVQFNNAAYNTTANDNGEWEVILSPMKAGGPYDMVINASNSVTVKDILIGDV
jgi:sialate O-acetylesterase